MSGLSDVRGFLRKAMIELADSEATPEEMQLMIDRAKAQAQVAGAYVDIVKTEIVAVKTAADAGLLDSDGQRHSAAALIGIDDSARS